MSRLCLIGLKTDIESLNKFAEGSRNGVIIEQANYSNKVFELALPDAPLAAEQLSAINRAKQYAQELGIGFKIVVVK